MVNHSPMSFCGVMVWALNFDPDLLLYNEGYYGKVPMDDVGGTIKNVIFQKVKSGQIVAHTPKEFSDAAMKFVPSIITVYLPKSDEIVEPESIYQAPSIPETLSIHKFV